LNYFYFCFKAFRHKAIPIEGGWAVDTDCQVFPLGATCQKVADHYGIDSRDVVITYFQRITSGQYTEYMDFLKKSKLKGEKLNEIKSESN